MMTLVTPSTETWQVAWLTALQKTLNLCYSYFGVKFKIITDVAFSFSWQQSSYYELCSTLFQNLSYCTLASAILTLKFYVNFTVNSWLHKTLQSVFVMFHYYVTFILVWHRNQLHFFINILKNLFINVWKISPL